MDQRKGDLQVREAELRLEDIRDTGHPLYGKALELYGISFPFHEQRERPSQDRILCDSEYHFSLVHEGGDFVALVLFWETEDFIYIEHLAVLPEMRGHGYGQRTLGYLGKKGKTLILEIDPPSDSISERRKGFYLRCGFRENPFRHIHPPYHEGYDGHELALMTYPRTISDELYGSFLSYLRTRVMADAF